MPSSAFGSKIGPKNYKDSVVLFVPENADTAAHDIGETAGVRHILTPRERGVRPVPVRSVQSRP